MPTSRATRVTSSANDESWSTIALTVVPIRRNSPLTGWPLDLQRHLLRQVAVGDGVHHAGDLGRRPDEVVDQVVDRVERRGPVAGGRGHAGALGHAALAADDAAMRPNSLVIARLRLDELVVVHRDVPHHALAADRQAQGEVALAAAISASSRSSRAASLGAWPLVAGAGFRGCPSRFAVAAFAAALSRFARAVRAPLPGAFCATTDAACEVAFRLPEVAGVRVCLRRVRAFGNGPSRAFGNRAGG